MRDITRPIKYALFKELDPICQKEYVSYLVENYGVTIGAISDMLGASRPTTTSIIKEIGCKDFFQRGNRMSQEQIEKWNAFLSGSVENS